MREFDSRVAFTAPLCPLRVRGVFLILRYPIWEVFILKIILSLLCCLLLCGCLKDKLPPGVVAEVNGEHIHLREVEALHDVTGLGVGLLPQPDAAESRFLARGVTRDAAVEDLRRKYGQSLTTLLVQKLMAQTLAERGMVLSDADVAQAEQEIRADYPEGEFEKSLQEEYIDPDIWRDFLRLRLAQTRFQEQVLRPMVRISAAEVASYFAEHKQDFAMPGRVSVKVYAGISKAQMEKARAELLAGETPAVNRNLTRQQLNLPPDRLPTQWRQDIKEAGRGKPTPVRELDGLFQVLVLEEDVAARELTVVQAYPDIEQRLVEEKLEPVFWDWLEKTLNASTIRVAAALEVNNAPQGK